MNCGVGAADRAIRIFSDLQLAELHCQRVEQNQPSDQRVSFSEDQLDGFRRLHGSYQARKNAEYATLGAAWNQAGRRRFGIKAAIARDRKSTRLNSSHIPL